MLNRSICWQLWDILCPWLALLLTEESTSLSLWPSESRSSFPSEFSTFSGSLVQVSPSLQGFQHSSSNQGFDFFGMVVALGMLSFAALVMSSTKECKGSASNVSSVIFSKHRSLNCSKSALENTQWDGMDHSSVVSLRLMVRSKSLWDNGHCHGYQAAPPMHFSGQVLV